MMLDFSGHQDNPDSWSHLTDEDKRGLELFGAVVFCLFMGALWLDAYMCGCF